MLKKNRFSLRIFLSTALSVIILFSGLFTGIIASAEQERWVINSIESSADLLWLDSSVAVTQDSEVFVQGDYSLKMSMPTSGSWKGMTVALPKKGALAGADAFYFFLKVPYIEGAGDTFHFALFYEYANGRQITHSADFNLQIQPKNATDWTTLTYYKGGDWGPNIPNGFEGYVKVPLLGSFAVSDGKEDMDVSFWEVSKIIFYFSGFGGEGGDMYFDALNYLPEDSGELIPYGQDPELLGVRVLNGLDKVADQWWSDTDIVVEAVEENAVQGDKVLKLSMDELMDWKGITLPITPAGILTDVEAIYFYIKTPTNANAVRFMPIYEYDGVQIRHDDDFNAFLQPKGSKSWQAKTCYTGNGSNWGLELPAGFEGYVKLPLTGAFKIQYTNIGETEVKLQEACRIGIYFSNFGGENGDIYLDSLCAVPVDNGSVIKVGNSFAMGDIDRNNRVNSEDLTILRQMVIGAEKLDLTYSDMDLSRQLNVIDIIRLKKIIAAETI